MRVVKLEGLAAMQDFVRKGWAWTGDMMRYTLERQMHILGTLCLLADDFRTEATGKLGEGWAGGWVSGSVLLPAALRIGPILCDGFQTSARIQAYARPVH
jgi:hypothetical protein